MRRSKNPYVFATALNRHPVRDFFRRLALFPLLLILLLTAGNLIASNNLHLETEYATIPKLPADMEGFSILQLSDLHGTAFGSGQSRISQLLHSVSCSCVVLTGDMCGPDGSADSLYDLLDALPKNTPVYLLCGDEDPSYLDPSAHGSLSPYADWAQRLVDRGVIILDEPILITRGRNDRARLWLVPRELYALNLDNLSFTFTAQLNDLNSRSSLTANEAAKKRVAEYQVARAARIRESLRSMKDGDVQISVGHAPYSRAEAIQLMENAQEGVFHLRDAALAISGHYTGGPWRLPRGGPVWVDGFGWFPGDEGISGWNWLSGLPQYISPGLGCGKLCPWQPFRLFNSPVITRIILSSSIH